jgi:carboxypeptidase C (cathepsin A)
MKITIILLISVLAILKPISRLPGYPMSYLPDTNAGYLNTSSDSRKLHYILLGSDKGSDNNDPLTLWLNGGPGCTSKLGFLQEIGPFYLEQNINYNNGDLLTPNPYSWTKYSNLLFLDSPAGVGYSINTDPNY